MHFILYSDTYFSQSLCHCIEDKSDGSAKKDNERYVFSILQHILYELWGKTKKQELI